jgi:hypothetical protein
MGGALLVAGCASEPAVVQQQAPARAPARWEAVLLPEATAQDLGDYVPGTGGGAWWDERRDAAMSYRTDEPLLASGQWPEPSRPSLDRPRYIELPKRPETLLYFRPW